MFSSSPTLSIIGVGRVGKTLARLFSSAHVYRIAQILNRSKKSSAEAVEFIGAGVAIADLSELSPADVFMIASGDDEIPRIVDRLAQSGNVIRKRTLVFHVSGALPASVLAPLRNLGAEIASVHPVKSFADPARAVDSFPGTWCAIEGEESAKKHLVDALEQIGGQALPIDPVQKPLYHSAFAFSCAFLTTCIDAAVSLLRASGVEETKAKSLVESLANDTVRNTFSMSETGAALTGPTARGDLSVIENHLQALKKFNPELLKAYCAIGVLTSRLAEKVQGNARESQEKLRAMLEEAAKEL